MGEGRGVDLLEPVGRRHRRSGGGLRGQGVVAAMKLGHQLIRLGQSEASTGASLTNQRPGPVRGAG